jgi:uncharacterized membrane protein
MQTYGKFWIAFLYAVAVAVVPFVSGDRRPDPSEVIAIIIAVLVAALTYLVPLVPSAPWIKTVVAALLSGAQIAATQVLGGIDSNDVLLIVATVLAGLGIAIAPAASPKTATAVGTGADSLIRS